MNDYLHKTLIDKYIRAGKIKKFDALGKNLPIMIWFCPANNKIFHDFLHVHENENEIVHRLAQKTERTTLKFLLKLKSIREAKLYQAIGTAILKQVKTHWFDRPFNVNETIISRKHAQSTTSVVSRVPENSRK